jgi:AcrR family transcriptional regulator
MDRLVPWMSSNTVDFDLHPRRIRSTRNSYLAHATWVSVLACFAASVRRFDHDVRMERFIPGIAARPARRRVPGAERREAIISAAVHEFALTGLHGTTVARIARRVDVSQPFVFTFFPTKLDLFLAAVDRCFDVVGETFKRGASDGQMALPGSEGGDVLQAMGRAYKELLASDKDMLMLQHQGYAACNDTAVSDRMRLRYAELFDLVRTLSDATPERLNEFFRRGMGYCMTENVAVAMKVAALAIDSGWVEAELQSVPA